MLHSVFIQMKQRAQAFMEHAPIYIQADSFGESRRPEGARGLP